MGEIDWNGCLPYEGEAAVLPLGEQTLVPNFRAMDLVFRWEILDSEEEVGYRTVTMKEVRANPTAIIIGAVINENSVNRLVKRYTKRFFVAAQASGSKKLLDRWQWYEATKDPATGEGMDVLELEALKEVRASQKPGGNPIFQIP